MKKLIVAIAVAAAAVYGYQYYAARKAAAAEAEKRLEGITVAPVLKGNIRITVAASGRVVPEREVEIKSKASGEVKVVTVDVSDPVKQGMLLFRLDPTDEERNVKKLEASLRMSEAKLEQVTLGVKAAEAKLEADRVRAQAGLLSAQAEKEEFETRLARATELHKSKVITKEELDAAHTKAVQTESGLENARVAIEDLKVQELELRQKRQEPPIAEAQVENDRIALADARQRLKETEVFAPIDGVLSDRTVQEGLIVSSGISNVGGGTTAMKIVDLSHIYSIAAVDEADIRGVKPGVSAVITADAFPGMEFAGKVVRVATSGVVESNVVTFDVKVEVEGIGKELLKPEMTTNVTFLIEEKKDALLVPAEAVVKRSDGEGGGRQAYVTVRNGNDESERKVQTGLSDGYRTEILSGVDEGQLIAYKKDASANSRWAGRAMGPAGPMGPPPGGRR